MYILMKFNEFSIGLPAREGSRDDRNWSEVFINFCAGFNGTKPRSI